MGDVHLGSVGGALFNAGMGAGTSYMQGGNPWIGAGAALMSYYLNQARNDGKKKDYGVKSPYEVDAAQVGTASSGTGIVTGTTDGGLEAVEKFMAKNPTFKIVKRISWVGGTVAAGVSTKIAYDEYKQDPTLGKLVKLGANATIFVLQAGSRLNPITGVIIGIADATGATQWLYNKIDVWTK